MLEEFLLSIKIIHTDLKILELFGKLRSKFEKKGKALADADLFIAATALKNNSILITGNIRHYNRIENLQLENWIR